MGAGIIQKDGGGGKRRRRRGGRAEPMKKTIENRFFMAQVHHGLCEIGSNGGRAEFKSCRARMKVF